MAEQVGSVFYTIEAKDKDLIRALEKNKGRVKQFDKELKKSATGVSKSFNLMGLSAAAAFGTIVFGAGKAVKAASDLNEQTAKFGVTFSDVMEDAVKASDELVNSYGLSTRESKEFLSTTGDLVKGLGFSQQATLDNSLVLNKLAVDVTSFKNVQGGTQRTIRAFNSAILGEREALKSLGFSITENEVKNRLFQKGQEALTGSSLRQAKALATIELITEKNIDAVGDFARTQDQFANVSRRVTARLEDMSAEVGANLTPALADLGKAFLDATTDGGLLKGIFDDLVEGVKKNITNFAEFSKNLKIIRMGILQLQLEAIRLGQKLGFFGDSVKSNTFVLDAQRNIMEKVEKIQGELADTTDKGTDSTKKELKVNKERVKLSKAQLKAIRERRKAEDEKLKIQADANEMIAKFGLDEIALLRKQGADRNAEINEQLKKSQITIEQANDLKIINEVETQEEITKIQKAEQQKRNQAIVSGTQAVIGSVTNLLGQFSSIIGQQLQIALGDIDRQLSANIEAIDAQTQRELEAAGLLEETEQEKRESEIQNLENQLTRTVSIRDRIRIKEQLKEKKAEDERTKIKVEGEKKRTAAEEDAEAQKRKQQRDAAKIQKQLALAQTAINIPVASFAAFKALAGIPVVGPGLGTAAAIAATALGLKQLDLIRKTPLPALQEGGVANPASQGQQVIVAEGGTQEAIIPLTEEVLSQLGDAIGGGQDINLTVNVLDETFFTKIEAGVANRDIIIDSGGIAAI